MAGDIPSPTAPHLPIVVTPRATWSHNTPPEVSGTEAVPLYLPPPPTTTPALVGSSLLRLGPKGGGTNGAARRFPAGRKSGEHWARSRGSPGQPKHCSRDMAFNFGAPSGTSGTSAATAAPAGESAPGPPSKARKSRARPLGPIPPGWGSRVALARGTPWGHLERVGGGGGGGRAAGCSGSAWGSHSACIPRGPAAGWLPATGDSARERPAGGDAPLPSRDPATPRPARPPGPEGFPPSPPQPGGCWPLPLVPFAPHSVPTSSALLTGSGAGQVYPRCEASCWFL